MCDECNCLNCEARREMERREERNGAVIIVIGICSTIALLAGFAIGWFASKW